MNTLAALLAEASLFQERLTEDVHVSALEKHLRERLSPLSLEDENPFLEVCKGPGIYYLEAKFPFTTYEELVEFGVRWGTAGAKDIPKWLPRYYPGRAKKQVKLIEKGGFIPFYLGKEFNVQSRLIGHMDGELEATTYALKLKKRAELLTGMELKFSYVEINVKKSGYFCVELLEKALRSRLNPIVGRQ